MVSPLNTSPVRRALSPAEYVSTIPVEIDIFRVKEDEPVV